MNIMANITEKRELGILEEATAAFQQETGFQLEKRIEKLTDTDKRPDALIDLRAHGPTISYFVEIKPNVTETTIGRLVHKFNDQDEKWLLVTRYVPTHLAIKMRELHIQFIDTVGNAYIHEPPILIVIHGNKRPQLLERVGDEGILGRAALHVVFALLCKRELEDATYREIAEAANVALGTVAGVMKDLTKQGFLIEYPAEKRKLKRKKELLDKWTTTYAERLRQKKLIGRYTANRPTFWQEIDLRPFGAQWGGEVAANKMTQYLKPELITLYTRKPFNDLVLTLKLRKDEKGAIELRERFWKFENGGVDKDIVPPLLVYADLLATADTRNIETAKLIYDEYLEKHISEN